MTWRRAVWCVASSFSMSGIEQLLDVASNCSTGRRTLRRGIKLFDVASKCSMRWTSKCSWGTLPRRSNIPTFPHRRIRHRSHSCCATVLLGRLRFPGPAGSGNRRPGPSCECALVRKHHLRLAGPPRQALRVGDKDRGMRIRSSRSCHSFRHTTGGGSLGRRRPQWFIGPVARPFSIIEAHRRLSRWPRERLVLCFPPTLSGPTSLVRWVALRIPGFGRRAHAGPTL
jgi:hypothetical protein